MSSERVTHEFPPVYDGNSRVLILGTIPSPKSRERGFYYMHPQNRFWKMLCAVLDENIPEDVNGRRVLCLKHGIALWDVLESCDITGAEDSSIKNAKPNDLRLILDSCPIKVVFTTGKRLTRYIANTFRTCPRTSVCPPPAPPTAP